MLLTFESNVNGFDVVEQSIEARRQFGYLPENAPLYEDMNVGDFLRFIMDVRKIAPTLRKASFDRVVSLTKIDSILNQRIETLSKGFKRRVGLSQALIHDPEILVLDEPTDGLDPNQKHDVRELLRSMAQEKCIILSTHILEEVDAVCSRIVVISKGKTVADSTPAELKKGGESLEEVFRRLTKEEK